MRAKSSSLIRPIRFSPELSVDIMVAVVATAMLFLVMFIGKRHRMERSQGVFFLILYAVYMVFLVMRG